MINPFELVTASKLTASEAVDLWSDDRKLNRVKGGESCFIHGNRGTGKSMLFRILQADCQRILDPFTTMTYFSVYFPVRDSDLRVEELELVEDSMQRNVLCESHLTLLIVRETVLALRDNHEIVPEYETKNLLNLLITRVLVGFEFSKTIAPDIEVGDFEVTLNFLIDLFDKELERLFFHVQKLLFQKELPFDGPLFSFDSILGPVADFVHYNVGKRVYILIDDGDDLPFVHTKILNTWISRRRNSIAFKVSTMYSYKTYETRSGTRIQDPHDFIDYDIASRFMQNRSTDYIAMMEDICKKRFARAGFINESGDPVDPYDFFPEDMVQRAELERVKENLRSRYEKEFEGRAVNDNVYRHYTSEYLKELTAKRSPHTFLYSGFRTLAILSGGLVRDFIICAQRMYDIAQGNKTNVVESIEPRVQNEIVRRHADTLLSEIRDANKKRDGTEDDWRKVSLIIEGLGATFKNKMLSDDSERRVFSFAFQSEPEESLLRLLNYAIVEAYLEQGFISKKEGSGRRRLYVLTRRIAPAYNLDVSSYSGYLSVMPQAIEALFQGESRIKIDNDTVVQRQLFPEDSDSNAEWGTIEESCEEE